MTSAVTWVDDPAEWRTRLETMVAAHRRRKADRAAAQATFTEVRRHGLEARHAERLARLDRDAECAEITARWAGERARAGRRRTDPR
ncbi:hypothetical protein [Dactylosporangium matsuzakiense]|uniref:Uncharacterized protein n=1 Tax=Dactylosporangium matsuzakiense TaxID=53360 RepID=A0A9W6KK69_9ACTN|nr:hypothetical protein [Dactylosporangium matsuzakiense]UWZ43228.1 hypothetical protein Dmats_37980 [Dactylosporangium matsuzakiense]GLL02673.1 hypothetical protein GCM10017581_044150 [Dactylosporangium matsuzakiense]